MPYSISNYNIITGTVENILNNSEKGKRFQIMYFYVKNVLGHLVIGLVGPHTIISLYNFVNFDCIRVVYNFTANKN